jgi:hypothetical protein
MTVTNIRHERLLALKTRIERQLCETELLLLEVHDFCRENPTVEPCIADDDAWIRQLERQRENLQAMSDAIGEKLAK